MHLHKCPFQICHSYFNCEECDFSTTQRPSLMKHIKNTHGEFALRCPTCKETFEDKERKENHKCPTQSEEESKYRKLSSCPFCGYVPCQPSQSKIEASVYRHIQNMHLGLKRVACNICNKKFSESTNLKKHIEIHHSMAKPREKKFKCEKCDFKTAHTHALKRHIARFHENKIVILCSGPSCNFEGKSRVEFKEHRKILHKDEKVYAVRKLLNSNGISVSY